ncbi:MAG: helix-turn-helix transcriptional regulator [Actinomycetota bacterium]
MAESIEDRFRRLLVFVPFVISNPGVEVSEVCTRFGITRRQLMGDIELLFLCGLPGYGPGDLIEASVDQGQVWIRMADYFSRPLRLTPAEGLMLYAGGRAMVAAGIGGEAVEGAMTKLEAALGPDALGRVSIGLESAEGLAAVREALEKRRRLHIVYYAHSKAETTERDVDPWALFVSGGWWYLAGWCHRVEDERVFRVDRMRSVRLLDVPAEVPADLDLRGYEGVYAGSADAVEVELEMAPEAAAWVGERYPLEAREPLDDGWERLRLSASGTAWLERLLLRLGSQARAVRPPELATRVRELACRVLERYRDPA